MQVAFISDNVMVGALWSLPRKFLLRKARKKGIVSEGWSLETLVQSTLRLQRACHLYLKSTAFLITTPLNISPAQGSTQSVASGALALNIYKG